MDKLKPGPDNAVSWRAYKQLDTRQAAAFNKGRYAQDQGSLSHSEQRAFMNAQWAAAKQDRRWGNRNSAGNGVRLSTTTGLRVRANGGYR